MLVRRCRDAARRVHRARLPGRVGVEGVPRHGTMRGVPLPAGLREADRLPEPVFTPSTKAASGGHDENITFDDGVALRGRRGGRGRPRARRWPCTERPRLTPSERGIIIADTKFELGLLDGDLVLADEVLTPDSSRFWPADGWEPGARRRASTSSRCGTGWRPPAGTSGRRRPRCPPRWWRPPGPATWRPTSGSPAARSPTGQVAASGDGVRQCHHGGREVLGAGRGPAAPRHRRSAGRDHRAVAAGARLRRRRGVTVGQGHPLHGRGRRRGCGPQPGRGPVPALPHQPGDRGRRDHPAGLARRGR